MGLNFKGVATATATALLLGFGANAMADGQFELIQALIAKGVLTEEEGLQLMKSSEVEKREAKKSTLSSGIKEGFKFETDDHAFSVTMSGRIHADYRNFNHNNNSNAAGSTPAESDTFDIRRARLNFAGQLYNYYTFQLSGDFAGGTNGNATTNATILDQAWVNVNYWKPLQFTVGQFKAPISMERKMSSNALDFLERSLQDALGSYEDRGIMVWGIPKDGLTYAVSVINGEGNKNSNDVDSRVSKPEVQFNGTVNFAELMGDPNAVYHLGVGYADTEFSKGNSAGTSTTTPNPTTWWVAGSNAFRTEARGINFLSLPTLTSANGGTNAGIERQRYHAEGAVALGPVKVVGEWMRNNFQGDLSPTVSFDNDIDAWTVSGLWNITGEKFADFYKDGIFKGVKPNTNYDWGAGGGTWQLGLRYSHLDASDFNNSKFAAPGGGAATGIAGNRINTTNNSNTFEAGAWTVGVNFVPNPNVRFMVNLIQTRFDTPIAIEGTKHNHETAVTARTQVTF